MQPPPPPSPVPAPAPPARPTAVLLPDGPVPLEGLPRTAEDVRGLRERREILRDQLERAGNRRSGLVSELTGDDAPPALAARTGLQQRLDALDARILQIEQDQALTERLLSNAPPAVLAQAAAIERRERQDGMIHPEEAAVTAAFTFGVGVLLTLAVGRIRRRIARRHGRRPDEAALPAAASDPRIDRLAQTVDAIAEEVERIGEGQRFVTRLLAERPDAAAAALRAEAGAERR